MVVQKDLLMDVLTGWCLESLLKNRAQSCSKEMHHQSWLKNTYSLPDGCAEGVSDGRVEGLVLGAVVGNPVDKKKAQ